MSNTDPDPSRFVQPPGESTGFTIVPPEAQAVPDQDAYDDGYLARVNNEPVTNAPAVSQVSWIAGWLAADKALKD